MGITVTSVTSVTIGISYVLSRTGDLLQHRLLGWHLYHKAIIDVNLMQMEAEWSLTETRFIFEVIASSHRMRERCDCETPSLLQSLSVLSLSLFCQKNLNINSLVKYIEHNSSDRVLDLCQSFHCLHYSCRYMPSVKCAFRVEPVLCNSVQLCAVLCSAVQRTGVTAGVAYTK